MLREAEPCEFCERLPNKLRKTVRRGAKDATVFAPDEDAGAEKEECVCELVQALKDRWAALIEARHHPALVAEMAGFVAENAEANRAEER